ncbi:hypothetical protein PUN28_013212 [Cardiocondyla obscurior]|uniref:Uncharacterized protein n=1 Tax=Cardiocondyla obscurior TaxID=286306 RepID=A0AAW2F8S1_9HYME
MRPKIGNLYEDGRYVTHVMNNSPRGNLRFNRPFCTQRFYATSRRSVRFFSAKANPSRKNVFALKAAM